MCTDTAGASTSTCGFGTNQMFWLDKQRDEGARLFLKRKNLAVAVLKLNDRLS